MRTALLAILSLTACGHQHKVNVPDEVKPYLDEFVEQSKVYGKNLEITDLEIRLGEVDGGVGACEHSANTTPVVTLKPTFPEWSDSFKRIVLFHELGHCLLGRKHRDETSKELGTRNSLMSKAPIFNENFERFYDFYMEELFDESKGRP